jgi:hypothetical protein
MTLAQEKIICIDVQEEPSESANQHRHNTQRIMQWFRKKYRDEVKDQAHPLLLPSVMELAGQYHWNILDVLEALFELKKQHYDYRMDGLDGEILLWDPLCRNADDKR